MKARIPEYFVVANSFLEVSIQVLGVSSKTMERERALGGCHFSSIVTTRSDGLF